MGTDRDTATARQIVRAIARMKDVMVYDGERGGHVCRFCDGDADYDNRRDAWAVAHRLDCLYLAACVLVGKPMAGIHHPFHEDE